MYNHNHPIHSTVPNIAKSLDDLWCNASCKLGIIFNVRAVQDVRFQLQANTNPTMRDM